MRSELKRNLKIFFAILFALGLSVFFFGNRASLGHFDDQDKFDIEAAFGLICGRSFKHGKCSVIDWHGKHRWFGRVNVVGQNGNAEQVDLASYLESVGWRRGKKEAPHITIFFKDSLSLSYVYEVPTLNRITIFRDLEKN